MKIGFSFENLYPAADRAGRHIETLVRRFAERGHQVFVVTTPSEDPVEPEGVEILRLREAPGAKGHGRSDTLLGKVITKFLKQNEVDVHFAEGLTPLSAITVKAAQRAGAKTVIRVLADASGIIHSIGGDKRLTPSALKKRISTILRYADAAAASSRGCADLLKDSYAGDVRVIEKCVDLSICNPERVQDLDISTLREKFNVGDAQVLIYSREEMRGETVASTIPLVGKLVEKDAGLILLIAGKIEDDAEQLKEAISEAGLEAHYRLCGRLSQRDLFAAYTTADVYLTPHDSRASESELLEALAMGCPIACYGEKAESAHALVEESNALVLDYEDLDGAAEQLKSLLDDKERLSALKSKASDVASSKDIEGAIDEVEDLFASLTGLPALSGSSDEVEGQAETDSRDEDGEVEASDSATDVESSDHSAPVDGEDEGEEDDEDRENQGRKRRRRRRRRRLRHDEDSEEDGEEKEAEGEQSEQAAPAKETKKTKEELRQEEEEMLTAAAARLRELDSKLTLRDLMPFLRPPKQVLVMSMASANGQHRAGDAIFEAFKSVDQNFKVKQVNIADFLNKEYDAAEIDRMVDAEYRTKPAMALEMSEGEENGAESDQALVQTQDSVISDKVFIPRFKKLLLEKRPHQIVLTHYLPIQFIAKLKREHDLKTRIAVVVTEYDLHPWWMAEGVDQYLVSSEKVRFKLLRAGVPSSTIDVSGIPVHPRFEGEIDRAKVRKDLGIRSNSPIVLLRPGGLGNTEEIMEIVKQITSVGYGFNLLILAGKNESLVKAVKDMKVPRGVFVKAFGFVNNIGDVMGVSDLMITRAVGHTVAEAFASGLPLLLLRPETKAEERTVDWFVERGVALKAHDGLDLEWLLTDVLRNQGSALKEMRTRAATGGRPKGGAAQICVDRVSRLLH